MVYDVAIKRNTVSLVLVLLTPCAAEISGDSLSPQTGTTHITEKAKTNSTNTTILFIVILSLSPFVFVDKFSV
jgi:hypothetical protein